MSLILGCNADMVTTFAADVPGALGCRSYRDNIIFSAADVPTAFPGTAGTFPCASIRPHPDYFLSTGAHYDPAIATAISAMITDGRTRFAGEQPQLTIWHEAGNLYGHNTAITPQAIKDMHVQMQILVNAANVGGGGTHVAYGSIIYGNVSVMQNWIPSSAFPLDWYGIDVYWNSSFDLSTYAKMRTYLAGFRTIAQQRSSLSFPSITVGECNTHLPANRPAFFKNLGLWMASNGGKRMLTFWREGGDSGGPWVPGDAPTIAALNYVNTTYGQGPPGGSPSPC